MYFKQKSDLLYHQSVLSNLFSQDESLSTISVAFLKLSWLHDDVVEQSGGPPLQLWSWDQAGTRTLALSRLVHTEVEVSHWAPQCHLGAYST